MTVVPWMGPRQGKCLANIPSPVGHVKAMIDRLAADQVCGGEFAGWRKQS